MKQIDRLDLMGDNGNMTRHSYGFTLIEILVVLLIISIIAGIVGVSVMRHPGEARVKAAKLQILNFNNALQLYRIEQNKFPTQNQGLDALCKHPSIPPVPDEYPENGYLDSRKLPQDPWNHDYIYLVPGRNNESYEIISYGSDGEPGGTGNALDISNSDL